MLKEIDIVRALYVFQAGHFPSGVLHVQGNAHHVTYGFVDRVQHNGASIGRCVLKTVPESQLIQGLGNNIVNEQIDDYQIEHFVDRFYKFKSIVKNQFGYRIALNTE